MSLWISKETHFIKADQIDLPTDVDSLGADAENADEFKTSLGVHNSSRHGCGQSWWNCDGYDVQRLDDDGFCWCLDEGEKQKKPKTFQCLV